MNTEIKSEIVDISLMERETHDPSEIRGRINCIIKAYNLKSMAHLARVMGVTVPTVSMWIRRGKLSEDLLIDNLAFINPEFIRTGRGKVRLK